MLAAVIGAPAGFALQSLAGQAFFPPGNAADATDQAAAASPDAQLYAEGKKAIHENRWSDAVKTFDKVSALSGAHAANALYWKAYAENKLGHSQEAMGTCLVLRQQFGDSSWVDDCGALEIEIKASKGQTVMPQSGQSDELKLLALATLMKKDPKSATAQIQEIVQGDGSETLKEGAVFILGELVPDATYAQIVRVSFLEGDVRIARESANEKAKTEQWEAAALNLPLQSGDSLVTGKDGRAEIELENASTVYLGENSVVSFQDLHTTGGVPHTELALVSGTVTMHLNSLMGGETFLLRTPTEALFSRYPEKANLRVSSYLDGIAVTVLGEGALTVAGMGKQDLVPGKTLYFSDGRRSTAPEGAKTGDDAAFDAWVADRYSARTSANTEVMQEAGLTKPIPGLAEMKDKGQFYECPPYGTCWMPSAQKQNATLVAPPAPAKGLKSAPATSGGPASGGSAQTYPAEWFPCMDTWYPGMGLHYPMGYLMNPSAFSFGFDPYAWAVCHSGWWMYDNNRHGYMWVAGPKRHHKFPGRWVKYGGTKAFVPLHPKDVKGQPPLNREHGFAVGKAREGIRLEPVVFGAGHELEAMKEAPREFRHAEEPALAHAEAPRMETRTLHDKPGVTARAVIPMTFNRQQGFVTSRQVIQGGRSVTVNAPVGRVGGTTGGGFSGHSGGSVGFGAVGTAHSGGGAVSASSGGGVAHGGGSAPAASSSSASSSSASSSPASSGSSHK
jgi:hypothetical protein